MKHYTMESVYIFEFIVFAFHSQRVWSLYRTRYRVARITSNKFPVNEGRSAIGSDPGSADNDKAQTATKFSRS